MNILLINPMASRKTPRKGRAAHFPIGIGLIASSLKAEGYNVTVLDNETECLNKYELSDYIKQAKHDIFGISAMATQYNYVKKLSRMIKEMTKKRIILGGPLATYSFDTVLMNTDVDLCVIGEGEETILDALENMGNLSRVPGVAFRHQGQIKKTPPRMFAKSRDEYPLPAYELFEMTRYFNKQQVHYEGWGSNFLNKQPRNLKSIGLVTGIGCPYRCKFCSRAVLKPRLRSIDNIISEIVFLKNRYNINGFRFIDELLILNDRRTLELCEKIRPLGVIWSGQARTNTLDDRLANAMKKAGCIGVGLGIESGSNRLLEAMKKQVTTEDHKNAISAAKNNGLAIQVQIMFGYPGENRESAEETISFFREVELPQRRFNILTPLPGSKLYDDCLEKEKIVDENVYLENVSSQETGFGSKRVLLNLTEMSNTEFEELMLKTERKMEENYKTIFKRKHRLWFLLIAGDLVFRQLRRFQKIFSLTAWKMKMSFIINKAQERKLSLSQIEELYFNI